MTDITRLILAQFIGLLVISVIPNPSYSGVAGRFTFRKVADTNTPIPGGTGTFEGFGAPSLDGGNVAFQSFRDSLGEPPRPARHLH